MKFHTSISRDLTDFNLAYLMDHDFVLKIPLINALTYYDNMLWKSLDYIRYFRLALGHIYSQI